MRSLCERECSGVVDVVFFFNDTATTEIYTLSLHDALPICDARPRLPDGGNHRRPLRHSPGIHDRALRSEEHTSELQSRQHLVCRLLLEKKPLLLACLPWIRHQRYQRILQRASALFAVSATQ